MTATIKQGDTFPPLVLGCSDNGTPVSLAAASEVRLRVSAAPDADPVIDTVVVPEDQGLYPGVIHYEWQAGDTDTPGVYLVEVIVTWGDGGQQTFPADGYGRLRVTDDLTEPAV